jgi:VanZ family protein
MLRVVLRFSAIACVFAIVILSWLPKEMEVRTGFRGQYEHVAAYLGTALLLKLGWPSFRSRWMGLGLLGLAAGLEAGQIWVPGRTSQFIDFAASSAGACIGLLVAHTFLDRLGRRT